MFIGLCTESVDVEPMFRESVLLPISDNVSLSCNLFATFFGVIMYRNGTCLPYDIHEQGRQHVQQCVYMTIAGNSVIGTIKDTVVGLF